MTDTNPPVGARITVEGVTWEFHATVPVAHWADVVTGRAANFDHHCALNALWRMQQRAEQAEAENAARWEQVKRYVQAIFPDHGCITGDCPHMLQTECDAETDRLITEALAGLAKLRTLAVEADQNRQAAGPGTQEHAVSIIDRLAALATPNQEPTP